MQHARMEGILPLRSCCCCFSVILCRGFSGRHLPAPGTECLHPADPRGAQMRGPAAPGAGSSRLLSAQPPSSCPWLFSLKARGQWGPLSCHPSVAGHAALLPLCSACRTAQMRAWWVCACIRRGAMKTCTDELMPCNLTPWIMLISLLYFFFPKKCVLGVEYTGSGHPHKAWISLKPCSTQFKWVFKWCTQLG